MDFNPRSHTGSDFAENLASRKSGYFNPRSHTGSDRTVAEIRADLLISIHAPTRGATAVRCGNPDRDNISIHAPTRGATQPYRESRLNGREFQSTLPHGERHCAPGSSFCNHINFNPRSHTGSDMQIPSMGWAFPLFQSTLPHGERQYFSILSPF